MGGTNEKGMREVGGRMEKNRDKGLNERDKGEGDAISRREKGLNERDKGEGDARSRREKGDKIKRKDIMGGTKEKVMREVEGRKD